MEILGPTWNRQISEVRPRWGRKVTPDELGCRRLKQIGNGCGVTIEKPILDLLNITPETPLTTKYPVRIL